jgi:Fe2+ or Zn2+ uptake regulation protein
MEKDRVTTQREIILEYLRSVKSHPSAQAVYSAVKKKLPRISLGTVYRNLKKLEKKREIREILAQESHYDGDNSCHAHFICQKCDCIFDIFDLCKKCNVLNKKETKVGKITRFQINLYGECKKCGKK